MEQSNDSLLRGTLRTVGRSLLPLSARLWLERMWKRHGHWPPVGWVWFGALRRRNPISRVFGYDRGQPLERYYEEAFFQLYADDVRGRVLEIAESTYTRRFGGNRVTRSDVLHAVVGNPDATIVADLTCADHVPSDSFDCIILTQTLHVIYDIKAALRHLHRILKPGGVLLATVPGINQISRYDMDRWGDYWRLTTRSAERLWGETFPDADVTIEAYGNVYAAVALMHGLATEDLKRRKLDYRDPDYQVTITIRAVKCGDKQ